MSFPFVSRERLEDERREKEKLEARLAALELDHKRLLDVIFQQNWQVQVYGTIPQATAPEPEVSETDAERQEREYREAHEEDVRALKATMRTQPSRVGPLLEEMMRRDLATKMRPAKVSR